MMNDQPTLSNTPLELCLLMIVHYGGLVPICRLLFTIFKKTLIRLQTAVIDKPELFKDSTYSFHPKKLNIKPKLTINKELIKFQSSGKFLGIIFDLCLTWNIDVIQSYLSRSYPNSVSIYVDCAKSANGKIGIALDIPYLGISRDFRLSK